MPHDEGTRWSRSRRCSSAQCVEVAVGSTDVLMRDSSDPDGGHLAVSREAWKIFIEGVKGDEFTEA
jgi:hypothetical protein